MSHTPEPWKHCTGSQGDSCICGLVWSVATDSLVATVHVERCPKEQHDEYAPPTEESIANQKRIVACINFCAGTDSDFLTGAGNLGKMLSGTGIAEMTAQRDQLLAACKAVCDMLPGEHACDPAFWPVVKLCRSAIRTCENTLPSPE